MKSHRARGMSRKWATGETFLVSSPSQGRDGIRSVADGPRRKRTSVAPKVGGSIWKFKSPKCWKREQRYRTQAARRHSIVTDDLGRRVTLPVDGPLYPQSTQPSTRSAPCLPLRTVLTVPKPLPIWEVTTVSMYCINQPPCLDWTHWLHVNDVGHWFADTWLVSWSVHLHFLWGDSAKQCKALRSWNISFHTVCSRINVGCMQAVFYTMF